MNGRYRRSRPTAVASNMTQAETKEAAERNESLLQKPALPVLNAEGKKREGSAETAPWSFFKGTFKGFVHGHRRLSLMYKISPATPKIKVIKAFLVDQLFWENVQGLPSLWFQTRTMAVLPFHHSFYIVCFSTDGTSLPAICSHN